MKPAISLIAATATALLVTGCGAPRPNPNQSRTFRAGWVNPYPEGTYAWFTADPSYPKTYNAYRNHAVLSRTGPGDSRVLIDLGLQRAILFSGELIAMDYPIASGNSSFPTPPGEYEVVEKIRSEKRSNLYGTIYDAEGNVYKSNANLKRDKIPEGGSFKGSAMPYWHRLTWDGLGMHQGRVPRYPVSHGCVRMPSSVAPTVFSKTKVGTPISIVP